MLYENVRSTGADDGNIQLYFIFILYLLYIIFILYYFIIIEHT